METTRPSIIARPEPRTAAELSRARKIPTKSHPVVRSRRPSRRPDLHTARRRAQRQSRMAEGHREAAPRVLDGREHGGSLAAEGRRPITRHIAVYPRKLTAANSPRYASRTSAMEACRLMCLGGFPAPSEVWEPGRRSLRRDRTMSPASVRATSRGSRCNRLIPHRCSKSNVDVPKSLRNQIARKLDNAGLAPIRTPTLEAFTPVERTDRTTLYGDGLGARCQA
jgi:hypothetical protein